MTLRAYRTLKSYLDDAGAALLLDNIITVIWLDYATKEVMEESEN